MLRFGIAQAVQRIAGGAFPAGTLAVNVIGCLAIGFVVGRFDAAGEMASQVKAFWIVGLFGGFTTFSAFGLDTVGFLREQQYGSAVANVLLQLLLGLLAVAVGFWLARAV
jgi:CrcB protein